MGSREHVNKLAHLTPLLAPVAARNRVLDTMGDVILEDFLLDPPKRGAHRRYLRDDIDTITVALDHAGEPTHLPFDTVEPAKTRRLGFFAHILYIPP